MKKLLLASAITVMSLPAFAEGSSLLFKTADGVTHSVKASGLEITFADGKMVAVNATESLTLPLADLSTMEFGDASAVKSVVCEDVTGAVSVVTVNGVMAGAYASLDEARQHLAPGVYVIKLANGETTKLIIRK